MGNLAAKYVIELVGKDAQLKKMLSDTEQASQQWSYNLARNASIAATALAPVAAGLTSINAISNQITEVSSAKVLADSLDVSVESLRAWQYAARTTGIEADKMGDIMKDVADKVGDYLTTGGGEAADAIEALNIPMQKLINQRPDQLLELILGKISQVNDPNQRAFLLESFADEAVRLQPLLANNLALFHKLKQQAINTGFAVDDADASKVKALSDAYKYLEGAIDGANSKAAVWASDNLSEPVNDLAEVITFAGSKLHLLDEALIISAGMMAGRYVPALRQQIGLLHEESVARAKKATELRTEAVLNQRLAQEEAVRLQTTHKAFEAERKLEASRMAAQISEKGRIQSAARFAEIRKAELAIVGQMTAANTKLEASNQALAASNVRYAQTATLAGRAANFFKSSVAFLGGPLGVAVIAATAIYSLRDSYDDAETSTQKLKDRTDELYRSLSTLSLFKTNELIFSIDEQIVRQGETISQADRAYRNAWALATAQAEEYGHSKQWVIDQTEKESQALSKEQAVLVELQGQYGKTKERLDEIFSSKEKFQSSLQLGRNGLLPGTGVNRSALDKLQQQRAQSASYIAQLDMQFADEQQKLELQHQMRLQKIGELQLSEQQLKARGFETLDQLQAEYIARSEARLQSQLEARQLREEERAFTELERVRQQLIDKELIEQEAWQRRDEILKNARDRGILEESNYQNLSQKNWKKYQDKLAQMDAARIRQQLTMYKGVFGDLSGLAKTFAGEQSGIYKALFLAQKGFSLASILLSNKQALANAWASAPFPQNLPAVAITAAETGVLSAAAEAITYHTGGIAGQKADNFSQQLKSGEVPSVLQVGEEVLTTSDPRHRNNLIFGGGQGGRVIEFNQINHFHSDGSVDSEATGDSNFEQIADRIAEVSRQVIDEEKMPGGKLYQG